MHAESQEERCAKCGKKKPLFGYLIQCIGCKRYYCKRCAGGFKALNKHQQLVDSCPECREKI